MNLVDLIQWQAHRRPRAAALVRRATTVTFEQLVAAIEQVAERLGAQGLAPGEPVGVAMRTSPLHLVVVLALARLGAVSVPVGPGTPAEGRRELAARFGVRAIVSDFREYAVEGVPLMLVDPEWATRPARVAPRPDPGEYDAPWRIALSSGTTGVPKGVVMTHAQTSTNILLTRPISQAGPDSRYLCFRDLDATVGLRPCLIHLAAGGSVAFPEDTGPAHFFEAVARHRASHASVSTGLMRSLLRHAPARRPACPELRHFEVSGAAMPSALAGEIVTRITPHLISTYGATETGRTAVADAALLRDDPDCSGCLVPWIEAQAVGEDGGVLARGERGVLRFRGPGFVRSYFNDPEATARAFRDGWFYPGDVGRIELGGRLYAESRVDDLVNLGGAKIAPSEVERVLERHPEVVEAAAFGVRRERGVEHLYAAVVTRGPVAEPVLLAHCREALGRLAPDRILLVDALPRNAAGKILRRELAGQLAAATVGRHPQAGA